MKRQIQGLLGLTALALGLGLGFSAPALATNYTCAAVPASVSGDTIIGTAGTACVIPAAGVTGSGNITVNGSTITTTGNLTAGASFTLNATSTVSINAVNSTGPLTLTTTAGTITTTTLTAASRSDVQINGVGNVTTGAVSAGGNIKAVSSSAILFLNGTVTSNTGAGGGNILLQAGTNVRTGAISTSGGAKTGAVQIDANKNGGNTLFTVGSNATNGVTSVNTSNSTGGGNSPTSFVGGLLINNGTAASTGGISVTSMSAINVAASASRSGAILLNAQNGTLTLPAGTLSSNGAAGFGAGQIILLANTVTTANGTIISAAQTSSAGATVHGVAIAATTVNVAGTSGLQLLGDGSGPSTATAVAGLFPKGAISISSSNVYNTLTWTVSPFTVKTNGPMTVAGASAPITLSANGDNSQVTVTGYPINFTNGAVNLSAKGSLGNGHNIVVQYSGSFTGTNGLTFGGNGAVTLDTSGNTGNDSAGAVSIMVDQASIAASVPSLTINANGSGSGNGGTVTVQPTKIVTLAAPTVNISANGPFGYVQFQPVLNQTTTGDASITSTTFNLNANGPTSGGNAGTIFYYTKNSTYGSSTKMKFSAIGPTSGSGNGGTITVYPGSVTGGTFKLGTNAGDLQVVANAGSTGGDGGSITVNPYPAPNGNISIETANALSATSSTGATANSKGGNVTLIANPNLSVVSTLTGAAINVDGKGTSDGGTIRILANGTLNLGTAAGALQLSAKGDPAGTGNGGTIEIGYISALTLSTNVSVAAGKGTGSNGVGGTINFHDLGQLTINNPSTIVADASGTGKGGAITLSQTGSAQMTLNNITISAKGSCAGSICSTINVIAPAKISATGSTIIADGLGNGSAGAINFTSSSDIISLDGATLSASSAASGNGAGGAITIVSNSSGVTVPSTKFHADGQGSGAGGRILVNVGTQVVDMSSPNTRLTAIGGDTGAGGIVSISNVSSFLVNLYVQVSSGSSVTDTTTFGGSISLNGVTCQNTLTSFSSNWPKSYWNCVNPGSPGSTEKLPAQVVSGLPNISNFQSVRSTIYVQTDVTQFAKFFGVTLPSSVGGYTFYEGSGQTTDTTYFENLTFPVGGYRALTPSELTEVSVHEMGHVLDISLGLASVTPGYNLGVVDDRAFLDAAGNGHPCVSDGSGPFNGVVDIQTAAQFCSNGGTGGVLQDPNGIYTGLTKNSDIAARSTYTLGLNTELGATGYMELYAQTYAFQWYAKGLAYPPGGLTTTANGLFQKGYYRCSLITAAAATGTSYTGPFSYSCN